MRSEEEYNSLLRRVIYWGAHTQVNDSNKHATRRIFSGRLELNISDNRLPLLTSRHVSFKLILDELLWFISGAVHTKTLNAKIWDANTTREYLDQRELNHYEEGETGPIYGFQWRHFGAEYRGPNVSYKKHGCDQLARLVDNINKSPNSRRHVVSAWNAADIEKMALPPCHHAFQILLDEERQMTMIVTMRSGDLVLGIPYNMVSYTILAHIIGLLTNSTPAKLIINIGDAHIYEAHVEQAKEQLQRRIADDEPRIVIKNAKILKTIDDAKKLQFTIENYSPLNIIRYPLLV